ncbi:MAG: folate family ECF transporter S component [Christensenellales bacterium]|jgi:ECF transporter S component (folate family)
MKNIFHLRTLIIMALLAALGAVFSAFMSIELAPVGVKIVEVSLTPIPVMLSGILFGPLAGGIVGFVADTAGFFMGVQHGAYNPVFSVTMALFGVIAGLFYLKSKKNSIWKVTGIAVTAQVVCSIMLNTLLVWLFYGVPLDMLLPTRVVGALIELPFYSWLLMVLAESLKPIVSKHFNTAHVA